MSPERELRTLRWRRMQWIPTIALSAIAVGVTAGVLVMNGLGAPPPVPEADQVTESGQSLFTERGLEHIDRTRRVSIDLSEAPVQAEPLGLPASGAVLIGPHDSLDHYLSFYGGGADPGGARLVVSTVTIVTQDGVITSVFAPLVEVRRFHDTMIFLRAEAATYGWTVPDRYTVVEGMQQATEDEVPYELQVEPGDSLGVPVFATALCYPEGGCTLKYELAPRVG